MAKFIELHEPCGDPLLINIEAISNVCINEDKDCYIVYLNGDGEHADEVSESYQTVKKMILDALKENNYKSNSNFA